MRRFFTTLSPVADLPCEQTLSDPFIVEHLTRVLRYKPGQELILIDKQAYRAEYLDDSLRVRLLEQVTLPVTKTPEIILAAVILKEQKWDWLLQKATELGVTEIQPLMSQHSVVEIPTKKVESKHARWQEIVRSAAQQSEQDQLPEVLEPLDLKAWLKQPIEGLKILLLERGERQTLKQALQTKQEPMILLVGPEGGWHSTEVDQLQAAGFIPVSLGDKILRSETAAIAAISMVLYEHAD